MSSGSIPDRLPVADGDLILSSAIDAQLGLFTGNIIAAFKHQLDADRLNRALDITLDAWPILGCRFVVDGRQMYWERLNKNDRPAFFIINNEQEYEKFCTKQVDSRRGPQINLGLYRLPDENYVILKLSHQVSDGNGFAVISKELSSTYNRLKHDPAYQPEPNIHGSRSGKQIIHQLPWTAVPVILANFIRLTWSNNHPRVTHTLPLAAWDQDSWMYKLRCIPSSRAARIVNYGKKHLATLNDVIITAYLRSLAQTGKWDGQSAMRIQMTVDLRSWYQPAKSADGICNLSAFEYVNLGTDLGGDFSTTLSRVSAITRARKARCFGLSEVALAPLVTLLPYSWLVKLVAYTARKKAAQKNIPCLLTNTGPISPETFSFDQPPYAAWVFPHVLFPPCFCVCVSGYAETLTLSAGVSKGSYALVDAFLDQMIAELPN